MKLKCTVNNRQSEHATYCNTGFSSQTGCEQIQQSPTFTTPATFPLVGLGMQVCCTVLLCFARCCTVLNFVALCQLRAYSRKSVWNFFSRQAGVLHCVAMQRALLHCTALGMQACCAALQCNARCCAIIHRVTTQRNVVTHLHVKSIISFAKEKILLQVYRCAPLSPDHMVHARTNNLAYIVMDRS